MIYKIKRFSFWGKTKAGLKGFGKGAKYGAMAGAALIPGNVTALLLGKPKTAAIITGVGAGLGGIAGGIYNASKSIDDYRYQNDSDYKAKIDKENKDNISKIIESRIKSPIIFNSIQVINSLKDFEEKYSVQFNTDLFSYIKFYEKFLKKNYKRWYEAYNKLIGNQGSIIIDDFTKIFPNPVFKFDNTFGYKINEFLESSTIGFWDAPYFNVATDTISYRDRSALYYSFSSKNYSFIVGNGYDSNSISETLSRFVKDIKRLINEEISSKIHNQIIDEFLNGLKMIK